jgi:CheY-like chemotaxis protein
MLVEDDNSLREIYQARLMAEGYQTVTAKDGEEALALVGQEKPDLIILDVMMPKISGFDTLDILRSTPATQSTKVIIMSALSQAEDKTRAEKLGANKYLVKSQVTLEDIVKSVKEVLASGSSPVAAPVSPPAAQQAPTVPPVTDISAPAPEPIAEPVEPTVPPVTTIPADDSIDSSIEQAEELISQQLDTPSAPAPEPIAEPVEPTVPPVTDISAPAPEPESEPIISAGGPQPVEETTPHTTVAISGSDTISPPLSSIPAPQESEIPGAEPDPEAAVSSFIQTEPPTTTEPASAPTPVIPNLPDPSEEPVPVTPQQVGGTKVVTPLPSASEDSKSRLDELLAAEAAKENAQAAPPSAPSPESAPGTEPTPPPTPAV